MNNPRARVAYYQGHELSQTTHSRRQDLQADERSGVAEHIAAVTVEVALRSHLRGPRELRRSLEPLRDLRQNSHSHVDGSYSEPQLG